MEEGPGEVTRVGVGRQSGEGPGKAMWGGARGGNVGRGQGRQCGEGPGEAVWGGAREAM